jgi:nucleoside-diphosphate-sugar epimerase
MSKIEKSIKDKLQNSVSILGCGWLGLPLAEYLIAKKYEVFGSTTRIDKFGLFKQKGISPIHICLNPDLEIEKGYPFYKADILIIAFPPRLKNNGEEFYLEQVQSIANQLNSFKAEKIIFTSSTSIYPNLNREVKENDADQNNVLFKAEQLLISEANKLKKKINILRLSGLMGYDRIPCKYFAGKKGLTNGENKVNYVHRDDVIRIIAQLIEENIWNETLNITAPQHAKRKDVINTCCENTGFEKPEFIHDAQVSDFKIINGDKMSEKLNYTFLYPDPRNFLYSIS